MKSQWLLKELQNSLTGCPNPEMKEGGNSLTMQYEYPHMKVDFQILSSIDKIMFTAHQPTFENEKELADYVETLARNNHIDMKKLLAKLLETL